MLTLPTSALTRPLLLRRTAATDFTVEIDAGEHGRLTVGRIMRVARAAGRAAWFWTLTGPAAPGALVALSGEAATREEAMTAFRGAWESVLAWAAAGDGRLRWHK
jgi:hypothetical protein